MSITTLSPSAPMIFRAGKAGLYDQAKDRARRLIVGHQHFPAHLFLHRNPRDQLHHPNHQAGAMPSQCHQCKSYLSSGCCLHTDQSSEAGAKTTGGCGQC